MLPVIEDRCFEQEMAATAIEGSRPTRADFAELLFWLTFEGLA